MLCGVGCAAGGDESVSLRVLRRSAPHLHLRAERRQLLPEAVVIGVPSQEPGPPALVITIEMADATMRRVSRSITSTPSSLRTSLLGRTRFPLASLREDHTPIPQSRCRSTLGARRDRHRRPARTPPGALPLGRRIEVPMRPQNESPSHRDGRGTGGEGQPFPMGRASPGRSGRRLVCHSRIPRSCVGACHRSRREPPPCCRWVGRSACSRHSRSSVGRRHSSS
jgi:hypothetical protein